MHIHIIMSSNFLRLLQSLDPLFPIGAFTLSNGMETYVQKNIVHDKNSLVKFLTAYLYTLPYNDIGFAAKAAADSDIIQLDELCGVSKVPREIREGSEKLCSRFLKIETAIESCPKLCQYEKLISENKCRGHYCIAVGLLIKDTGTDLKTGLEMYCYSILSAMVNHCVKLVPLRQIEGQHCLHTVTEKIPSMVEKALNVDIYDLGINGAGFELRSMQHEKLYSRLYIS